MDIDQVITLDDNNEYVLLVKAEVDAEKYFLAAKMSNGEPTEEYEVLKELIIDNEFSVETVEDEKLRETLFDKFEDEFDKLDENEDQD